MRWYSLKAVCYKCQQPFQWDGTYLKFLKQYKQQLPQGVY
jgi:hypothetical protein